MPGRSFDDDAAQATASQRPVPRGIAFEFTLNGKGTGSLDDVQAAVRPVLPDWEIRAMEGLPGWYEAVTPVVIENDASRPRSLGEFWRDLRALRHVDGVKNLEPLLLISSPEPAPGTAAEAFAAGFPGEAFNLWGFPYDRKLRDEIEKRRAPSYWHLTSMRVREDPDGGVQPPAAWTIWKQRFPNLVPGHDIVVGHPDTGYSEHPEVVKVFTDTGGRSFIRDARGNEEPSALDDLSVAGDQLIEAPGHGTGTASVIASGEGDWMGSGEREVYGVAPGARVLPLRVSRSVIHFDFGNVGRAILYAIDQNVDVISMSLGGPGYSGFVREAIGKALDAGVIVVAAAGNYLPATAFPAAFPEVIGVGATQSANGPWRFSAIGRLVDISAPGEDVWHAVAEDNAGQPGYSVAMGTGTSYATACVAGVAALWLSYHGGRQAIADHYGDPCDPSLVPFAFQYLLAETANTKEDVLPVGVFTKEHDHGKGLVDAAALLSAELPDRAVVEKFKDDVLGQRVNPLTFLAGLLTGGQALTDAGSVARAERTLTPGQLKNWEDIGGNGRQRPSPEHLVQISQLAEFFERTDSDLLEEVLPLIAADRTLLVGLHRWRPDESKLPLLDRMLGADSRAMSGMPISGLAVGQVLSEDLRDRLLQLHEKERKAQTELHKGSLGPPATRALSSPAAKTDPPEPLSRPLRAFSFDPSLGTKLDTVPIYRVTIPVRWEESLRPGPIGEYLEVVDVDPASGCVYAPVDLNHPRILAQEGLPLSEGNPQFHQQMVYAVAMNTINRFELALGRPIFWAPLRPWARDYPEERERWTPEAVGLQEQGRPSNGRSTDYDPLETRYVQRLRVYPHALREANAYYSPTKRALLFGYFPSSDEPGSQFPGGTVFTCLSHDIVAHETTHALVDGMHPYFNEATNDDVWAFHEAFADIMALFQHFTYPEVLRHQLSHTRGDLQTDNLLGQLAQQFGQATGQRGALRNYLGKVDEKDGIWKRTTPDPHALEKEREPHARGSILVAAVFDAFLSLYNDRIRDLVRLATGGTGVLPAGDIHPDLVNRLASEAARIAEDVLQICIRAMDYVPPVDITFGEYLRALITADYDLAPGVGRRNRIAFIEAFRAWGIYPRDVTTLSEDSLRWLCPDQDHPLQTALCKKREDDPRTASQLAAALESWEPGKSRDRVFQNIISAQRALHELLKDLQERDLTNRNPTLLRGLDWRQGAPFTIQNLRPARRVGPRGEFRTEVVVEIIQTDRSHSIANDELPLRGGATLVVDLSSWEIRYIILKRLYETLSEKVEKPETGEPGVLVSRLRQRIEPGDRSAWWGQATDNAKPYLRAAYSSVARRRNAQKSEPFALLHGDA